MTATPHLPTVTSGMGLALWMSAALRWVASPVALIYAASGFAVAFVFDAWRMIFKHNGFGNVPKGSLDTGQDNVVNGMICLSLLSVLVWGLAAHWRRVKTQAFLADMKNISAQTSQAFQADGAPVWTHVLWGAVFALLAGYMMSPMASLILAFVLVAGVLSPFGQIMTRLISRPFVLAYCGPQTGRNAGPEGMVVGFLALAATLIVAFFIPTPKVKFWGLILFIILAVLMSRQPGRTTKQLVILIALSVAIHVIPGVAHADTGGWADNNHSLKTFMASGALKQLFGYLLWGGLAGAIGAVVGGMSAAGNTAAPRVADPPPAEPFSPAQG